MAEADLDVVIRSIAKKQVKVLTDAAKKRHGRLMTMAAKAKNKESRDRLRHLAQSTQALAGAAARRLQITAENAAESYARAIRKAAEELPAAKSAGRPARPPGKPAKAVQAKASASKAPGKKG